MRVLVTGGRGQIGTELVEHLAARGDDVVAPSSDQLDVTDRDAVLSALTTTAPDAVFHCAAMTDVDGCESAVDDAFARNALAVRHVAEGARLTGAHLVHLSTDYVFDGTKDAPYDETDRPNPLSVYGRTKLAGEVEAAAAPSVTIIRTSWVCGRHGSNVVRTLLRLAADGASPRFVIDQVGHPTIVADLVPLLRRFAVERRLGLFHVTNEGAVSSFALAQRVFALAGHDPDRITPITTAEVDPPRAAPRPANSVLDNAALRASGLPGLPHFEGSLSALVAALSASG